MKTCRDCGEKLTSDFVRVQHRVEVHGDRIPDWYAKQVLKGRYRKLLPERTPKA
jgi:hypothetical protein